MSKKKVILAYSGGLDTSVIIKWLMERDYTVICYMADVGQGKDNKNSYDRALKIGAEKCIVDDLKKQFIENCAFYALKAGSLYQGKYNMATALSRAIIAEGMIKYAKKEKAVAVAHGCTGKGNDQVRFEVTFQLKAPNLEVLAPVRTWELKTREDEIDYAKKHNIPIEQTKKKIYSIDCNLWGTSIEGGELEDPWTEPSENTYISINRLENTPNKAEYIKINFEKGVPVSINGKKYEAITIVEKLNKIGAKHGIGRVDIIEDRLVGIKSREIYETPASNILYAVHESLENLVLDRATIRYKKIVANKYAELIYEGLWCTPLKESIDKFIDTTQKNVSGEVKVKLYKGNVIVCGTKSKNSRYKMELATYGKKDEFDQTLSKGFIDLWAMPYK